MQLTGPADLVDTLCHYTTAENAFAHILPAGRLRMSPYARMRDPLENRELPFGGAAWGDESGDLLLGRIQGQIKTIRDSARLLSFTVDAADGYTDADEPFQRAWSRARMWEQYAENHAGACLVFDREHATRAITADLNRRGAFKSGPVAYSPRGFSDTTASTLLLNQFHAATLAHDTAEFVVDHEEELFYAKTLDWQSEHEYRFTILLLNEPAEYIDIDYGGPDSIRAVILGEDFPAWQLPAARAVCGVQGIELRQMAWLHGRPWPIFADRPLRP